MRFPLQFFPVQSACNFIDYRKVGYAISALLILVSIGLFATQGLKLGIDFTGGALIEVRSSQEVELAPLRQALDQPQFGEVSLQHFGDTQEVLIRLQGTEGTKQSEIVAQAKSILDGMELGELDYRKVDFVGPTVGKELVESAYWSLAVVIIAILLYIWFRFEWQFGVGAIIALVHDGISMIGFFAITELDFGLPAVAAILTVLGYSINDSVVIYDRVRENLRKYKRKPLTELLNQSINDTLSRTILTAGTTLLSAGALILFGGEVIKGFSMALFAGVVIGTYSSIFVATPLLLWFNIRAQSGANATA